MWLDELRQSQNIVIVIEEVLQHFEDSVSTAMRINFETTIAQINTPRGSQL